MIISLSPGFLPPFVLANMIILFRFSSPTSLQTALQLANKQFIIPVQEYRIWYYCLCHISRAEIPINEERGENI